MAWHVAAGYFNVPVFPLLPWVIKTGVKHFPLNCRELQVLSALHFIPQNCSDWIVKHWGDGWAVLACADDTPSTPEVPLLGCSRLWGSAWGSDLALELRFRADRNDFLVAGGGSVRVHALDSNKGSKLCQSLSPVSIHIEVTGKQICILGILKKKKKQNPSAYLFSKLNLRFCCGDLVCWYHCILCQCCVRVLETGKFLQHFYYFCITSLFWMWDWTTESPAYFVYLNTNLMKAMPRWPNRPLEAAVKKCQQTYQVSHFAKNVFMYVKEGSLILEMPIE